MRRPYNQTTMGLRLVRLLAFVLSLISVKGRQEGLIFGHTQRRDLQQGDNFLCEDGILRELKANLDIIISDVSSGCSNENALIDIGAVIQDVVAEVEEDIPRYENENMETLVCPLPLIEFEKVRLLRADDMGIEDSGRDLQKKKKKEKRRRYRYRGGVKCQRCLRRNSDRRLQDLVESTCNKADIAVFAADMAATAIQNAVEAINYLKKKAIECEDLKLAAEAVTNGKTLLQQCRDSHEIAMNEAKRARSQCTQSRNAGPGDDVRQFEQLAGTASNDALNAARNAKRRYIILRDSLDQNVCDRIVQEPDGSSVTIDQVCREAGLADFGSDIAASAVSHAAETYSILRQRALECDNILELQPVITNAKHSLQTTRRQSKMAKNGAKKANNQCSKAKKATSGAELLEYMQVAEKASDDALDAAEQTRTGDKALQDELDRLDVCDIARSPISPPERESPDQGMQAPPQGEYEDESIYEQSLKDWLVTLARALYDTLPKRLMEEYEQSTFPPGCNLKGFDVKIRIEVLESSQELTFFVTEEACTQTI